MVAAPVAVASATTPASATSTTTASIGTATTSPAQCRQRMRHSLETVAPLLQAPFESRLRRALVNRHLVATRVHVYRGDSLHPMRTHRRDAAHDGFVKRLVGQAESTGRPGTWGTAIAC